MFKNKEIAARDGVASAESGGINTIVPGTVIEGVIITGGNIRFDGTIRGKIESKGKVVIGNSGNVIGDIVCVNADISGKVKGNIKCSELTSLKATSDVSGDIFTGKLSIEPGAVFSGKCNMSNQAPPENAEPAEKKQ